MTRQRGAGRAGQNARLSRELARLLGTEPVENRAQTLVQPREGAEATALPRTPVRGAVRKESEMERHLAMSIAMHGLPEPAREYRFHAKRQWRVDFCWPAEHLAVECEGGAFQGPGHRSVGVFLKNIEKYNALTLAGFRLLRFTSDQVKSGEAVALIRQALEV